MRRFSAVHGVVVAVATLAVLVQSQGLCDVDDLSWCRNPAMCGTTLRTNCPHLCGDCDATAPTPTPTPVPTTNAPTQALTPAPTLLPTAGEPTAGEPTTSEGIAAPAADAPSWRRAFVARFASSTESFAPVIAVPYAARNSLEKARARRATVTSFSL